MRVLIAGTYGSRSGIETYTRTLAQALGANGIETIMVDRSPGAKNGTDLQTAALHVAVPPPHRRTRSLLGSLEALRSQSHVRLIAQRADADLIHASFPELAPDSSVPLVVTAWDPLLGLIERGAAAARRGEALRKELAFAFTDRLALRRATGIVAVNMPTARVLADLQKPIQYVPGFVDDSTIRQAAKERRARCVMIAGRLDEPRKALPLAIEAVARARRSIPGLRLVLVGGWRDPALAGALPSFCDVRGLVSREEIVQELAGAACCLLTSIWEEFGYVGVEALAVGTPLVCGNLPAYIDLSPEAGVLIAPGRDADSFARAIFAAWRLGGFEFPSDFRASTALRRLRALYGDVLAT